MKSLIILLLVILFISSTFSRTAQEWKSRSIYQIITDRFARTDGSSIPCGDLGNYCGGTFKGILQSLDYIQGMGFDAIWISPVVSNTAGGYHGYWVDNLYEINPYFGTAEELQELIETCHSRDIWVMVDIVANHVGYVDNWNYSSIVPFNDAQFYNPYVDCATIDQNDEKAFQTCWLTGLPDLDQNHPFVKETLLSWVRDFVQTYGFDALRIDTVPHVTKEFWADFSKAAGVYTIGEVLNFDTNYLASFQGPLDSILNYALYSTLRYSFQKRGSMRSLERYFEDAQRVWPDISLLGNFINNHDNPRFLSDSNSVEAFKAALAFTICSVGIPMVYYGDEQAFSGGQDPANRETLWTDMRADSDIYSFLKSINKFRKETHFYNRDQVQRYADDSFYAFTRGEAFFAFTNSEHPQTRTISYHTYTEGSVLCNIFDKKDCTQVRNKEFQVSLLNGEVKILVPQEAIEEKEEQKSYIMDGIKVSMTIATSNL